MNIVLGNDNLEEIDSKYTVLELDTFVMDDMSTPITAYCLVENLPIAEMSQLDNLRDLHKNLIKNYRAQNWDYCEQAIEHLKNCWNGELVTFYQELDLRISQLRKQKNMIDSNHWIIRRTC